MIYEKMTAGANSPTISSDPKIVKASNNKKKSLFTTKTKTKISLYIKIQTRSYLKQK